MNVPVLVIGDSGSGKSSSFRNLPPEKTVILNTERKSLPFKGFKKFNNIDVSSYINFKKVMKELRGEKGTAYDHVVIDSLTSLIEIINKYCESTFNGYSIWKEYNDMIWNTLQDMKALPQQVYVTAIPELIETKEVGEFKAFAKVKAKEWKGAIEKEFTIVVHTDMIADEEGDITDYKLDTRPSRRTSAKSPHEMFSERFIPNDVVLINKAIKDYYEEEEDGSKETSS